jgi:uncharacterized glyoxalase superfamily protein PhnB
MTVSAIPTGYPRVSPYLIVDDAAATLAFMTDVFDGELLGQHTLPDGRIMHAEVRIGDSVVMVGGASPQWPAVPAALHIYVPDVDATYRAALATGAQSVTAPETKPYGDRSAYVTDACGTMWFISMHVEDVPADELARRMSGGGA